MTHAANPCRDAFFPANQNTMTIPNAEQIEGAYDAIQHDAAMADDVIRCTKELHVGNPPFMRGLTSSEFALAARAYFLGLKVAKYMVESGVKL